MTQSKTGILAVLGITVVLIVIGLVLARTVTLEAPNLKGAPAQDARANSAVPAALMEDECDAIKKVELGITEEDFKRIRAKARPEVDIDSERYQEEKLTSSKTNLTYVEFQPEVPAYPRFCGQYHFDEGKLTFFSLTWNVLGEQALSTASLIVGEVRSRCGKEDEQIVRDRRDERAGGPPQLGPELVWRRTGAIMKIEMVSSSEGAHTIVFAATDHAPSIDSLYRRVPVTEAEKSTIYKKFGIPVL